MKIMITQQKLSYFLKKKGKVVNKYIVSSNNKWWTELTVMNLAIFMNQTGPEG